MGTEIVPATTAHAERMVPFLSEETRRGLEALGREPMRALLSSLGDSAIARTILIDGEPDFVGGVVTRGWGGQLWFMTSVNVLSAPKAFLRGAKQVFAEFQRGYSVLANVALASNVRTIHLAEHFGFTVTDFGRINGHPFVRTVWEAPVVHRG